MTKRRLTIAAVSRMVQSGSFAAKSGSTASCDEPAYTANDMPSACGTVSTDFVIAMPVTRPQENVARTAGEKVRTPSKKARRFVSDSRSSMSECEARQDDP